MVFQFSVCAYIYAGTHVCVAMCAYVCKHMWRPEDKLQCLPQDAIHSFWRQGLIGLGWLAKEPQGSSYLCLPILGLQECISMSSIIIVFLVTIITFSFIRETFIKHLHIPDMELDPCLSQTTNIKYHFNHLLITTKWIYFLMLKRREQ